MSFSGHQLLPHLNILQKQFLEPLHDDDERFRSTYFDLELLPYALGATWHALSEFARIQREIVAQHSIEELRDIAFFGLPADRRDLLSYMFDNFLDASRRAQNSVIHYLSRGLRKSLPFSMSDLVKQLRDGQLDIPPLPKQELIKYWDEHGQRLKDYRDLSQHHALVTSDARLVASSDGRIGVYLLLPSNPEVKSAGKLVFGNPEIHAFPYAKKQFKILVAFLDWLTKGLLPRNDAHRGQQMLLAVFRDPAKLGAGIQYTAHVPPEENKLRDEITALLAQLRT